MKIVTEMLYGGYVILMSRVKDIRLKVIPSKVANDFVKKHHYSRSVAFGSRLNFGCFLDSTLHGVLQYGNPIDKRKVLPLVFTEYNEMVGWNEFVELNRMVFDDYLPKYSESRCIAVSIRLIKKNAPHIKWILSFADGTQCGDGTIYRASGFKLTNIKENKSLCKMPNGVVFNEISTRQLQGASLRRKIGFRLGETIKLFKERTGSVAIKGNQLRYIYLIDKTCKITVPILPFSKIKEMGASMYLGKKICDVGVKRSTASFQDVGGGAIPTTSLHLKYA